MVLANCACTWMKGLLCAPQSSFLWLMGRNLERRIPLSTKKFLPYPSIDSLKILRPNGHLKRKIKSYDISGPKRQPRPSKITPLPPLTSVSGRRRLMKPLEMYTSGV